MVSTTWLWTQSDPLKNVSEQILFLPSLLPFLTGTEKNGFLMPQKFFPQPLPDFVLLFYFPGKSVISLQVYLSRCALYIKLDFIVVSCNVSQPHSIIILLASS